MNVHVNRSAYYIYVQLVSLVETNLNFKNVGVWIRSYLFCTRTQKMPVSSASVVRYEVLTGILISFHVLQHVSYLTVDMASCVSRT